MAKINESMVILTGGVGYENDGQTILVDMALNQTNMLSGPKLKNRRFYHACGTFIHNENIVVIVAGSYPDSSHVKSTELWYTNSVDANWIEGTLRLRIVRPLGSVWGETTLNSGSVGGAGVDPPT